MKKILVLILLSLPLLPCFGKTRSNNIRFENIQKVYDDGLLRISFDLRIDRKTVHKSQSLLLIPQLQGVGETLSLPYIQLDGRDRCKAMNRMEALRPGEGAYHEPFIREEIQKNTQKLVSYRLELPFEPWMEDAVLSVKEELHGCAGAQQFYAYELWKPSVESAPTRYKKESYKGFRPLVSYVTPQTGEKVRSEKGQAFLDFPQGQSVILPSFRRNPTELRKIQETIDRTRRDGDLQITGITITGYASPEGRAEANEQLSWERAQSLRSYIQQNTGLSSSVFEVTPGGEDWQTLRKLVEESYLPQKDRVLLIIDGWDGFDQKERRLQELGDVYSRLRNAYYPQLRRVDYEIRYTVRDYSMAESRDMLSTNPGKLSAYELYTLAGVYEKESAQWNEMIELGYRLNPEDEASNINYAGVLLNRGEYHTAKECLNKVADLPGAWNNLGVYYLYTGDLYKAKEYLTKAVMMQVSEAIYNMEVRRDIELYIAP